MTWVTLAECSGKAELQEYKLLQVMHAGLQSGFTKWGGVSDHQSACLLVHLFLWSVPHNNFGRHHPVSKKFVRATALAKQWCSDEWEWPLTSMHHLSCLCSTWAASLLSSHARLLSVPQCPLMLHSPPGLFSPMNLYDYSPWKKTSMAYPPTHNTLADLFSLPLPFTFAPTVINSLFLVLKPTQKS